MPWRGGKLMGLHAAVCQAACAAYTERARHATGSCAVAATVGSTLCPPFGPHPRPILTTPTTLPWSVPMLQADEIEERHRRDGFEAASADRIFESTTLAAKPDEI